MLSETLNGGLNIIRRYKLVGLGSRPRYRAVFTVQDDQVFVLVVRAAEEDRLTTDDIDFDAGSTS